MTDIVAVCGGKGGCGKTTTSIALATALNNFGKDVTLVDANLTSPSIGLHLGTSRSQVSIHDVILGDKHILEAVQSHHTGTKIIPGDLSRIYFREHHLNRLKDKIQGLRGTTDFVILDSPAGHGLEARESMRAADKVIVITNPEIAAVVDALKTVRLAKQINKEILGIVIAKKEDKSYELTDSNIKELLGEKIIGIIPDDEKVKEARKRKESVILTHPNSDAAIAYKLLAANIIGKEYNEERREENISLIEKMWKFFGL